MQFSATQVESFWVSIPGLGGLAGVAVRLRFEIHRAKLYAFQFGKGD